jgi:hypothetical protein
MLALPKDAREEGERISAFWGVLNNCFSSRDGTCSNISLCAQQPFEPFDGFFDVRTYGLNGSNGFNFEAYFDTIRLL